MQTFTAEATVVDISGPSVSIVFDTPIARGEWVGGKQSVDSEAAGPTSMASPGQSSAGHAKMMTEDAKFALGF
jgi:hypothetical protein